ncbi:Uncharacterized protein Fot_12136 [Forsythia ovata]|uniref:Uncharacterized protein n=1 Tax=Forsythia ovata TaxID=205694 RepID=A0ABD1WLN9_9LAMI
MAEIICKLEIPRNAGTCWDFSAVLENTVNKNTKRSTISKQLINACLKHGEGWVKKIKDTPQVVSLLFKQSDAVQNTIQKSSISPFNLQNLQILNCTQKSIHISKHNDHRTMAAIVVS